MDACEIKRLEDIATQIRIKTLSSVFEAQSGHPGGSLSIAEMLAALYFHSMRVDPAQPRMQNRDRFVLSKGHAAPALYAALQTRGYFAEEELHFLRKLGHMLQGHPDMRKVPGVDMSTGSLGQGIAAAVGMALSLKRQKTTCRVYAILGDGELQEGEVWEAFHTAAHYRLSNLCALVDANGLQIDGEVQRVMNLYPLEPRFTACGWRVESVDGHSIAEIVNAVDSAREERERPTVIVCRTVKGKGVSYMENAAQWHGSVPSREQYELGLAELMSALHRREVRV